MKLTELIQTDAIITDLTARDRNGVIKELVNALAAAGALPGADPAEIAREVIQRENQGSTGFGKGVAAPHAKIEQVERVVAAIGRCADGIDFSALDRAPVYTIILLLAPKAKPELHLQAMESIFRHMQRDNFRRFLRQAATRDDIVALLKEADEMPR